MNEENRKILHQDEALESIAKDILISKPNDIEDSKSNDLKISKLENISFEIKDNYNYKDFVWGIKQSGNKYKSVTIKNELYALNDCVRCRSGLELDYIGKIMKLSEENDQKVCTLRWFFRPFELPTSLQEIYKVANTRELYFAFGEGIGVENKNLLVSCYNLSNIRSLYSVENVVSLEVIIGKCEVLCIAKDEFNDLPSSEHLNTCDFFFSKAFNCDTLQIVGLDGVVDAIGAQKVYNKKEWLNWNKKDIHSTLLTSSPKKSLHQSFDSHTMPTKDVNVFQLAHDISSPTIRKQSTKTTVIKKRKRESLEKVISSPKMMKRIKKTKLSSSQNPKFLVKEEEKQDEQVTKSRSEVKSTIASVDASNIGTLNLAPNLYKVSKPTFDESFKNDKLDGNSKNCTNLSSDAHVILEQTTKRKGNNADDIHVTCEGFPMESFLEPLENSKSSTCKFKKDESNSKLIFEKHGISEIGELLDSKKNKATTRKEQKAASKAIQNKKEPNQRQFVKSNVSRKPQNKQINIRNGKNEDQLLDTLHHDESQNKTDDIMKKHEVSLLDDEQLLGSPLATTIPMTVGENSSNKEFFESFPSNDVVTNTSNYNITIPLEQKFESICEDLDDEIEKAITAKRILLLNNIDPGLHSIELQETLSKFLETKCQVQKIMPHSFYCDTASALLKLPTSDIAQRILQHLCKDCLIVGERILIATLYEGLEFTKELYQFYGHILIQPKCEMLNKDCIEVDALPHVAEGNTIEFTFGLRWRLLQEQHELQWQLLNELHRKELNLQEKDKKSNKRLKKTK